MLGKKCFIRIFKCEIIIERYNTLLIIIITCCLLIIKIDSMMLIVVAVYVKSHAREVRKQIALMSNCVVAVSYSTCTCTFQ